MVLMVPAYSLRLCCLAATKPSGRFFPLSTNRHILRCGAERIKSETLRNPGGPKWARLISRETERPPHHLRFRGNELQVPLLSAGLRIRHRNDCEATQKQPSLQVNQASTIRRFPLICRVHRLLSNLAFGLLPRLFRTALRLTCVQQRSRSHLQKKDTVPTIL